VVCGWLQFAVCVSLFPVPLPVPGFFLASDLTVLPCSPQDACLGVNASAVVAAFSEPAAAGQLRCEHFLGVPRALVCASSYVRLAGGGVGWGDVLHFIPADAHVVHNWGGGGHTRAVLRVMRIARCSW
jgi:hypothetical protein